MDTLPPEVKKTEENKQDPLDLEAKGYKDLKVSRWRTPTIPEDPNAPVKF